MNRAAQHSQRAAELEGLLSTVKTRVQDLEDRCLGKAVQQLSHTQQLQQENLEMQVGQLRIMGSAFVFFKLVALNMSVKMIASYFKRNSVRLWSRSCSNRGRKWPSSRRNCISPLKKKSYGYLGKDRLSRTSATKSASRIPPQTSSKPLFV